MATWGGKFSERLVALRGGMSQADFGRIVGKDERTVRNWENGGTQPTLEDVANICGQFSADPYRLLGLPSPSSVEHAVLVLRSHIIEQLQGAGATPAEAERLAPSAEGILEGQVKGALIRLELDAVTRLVTDSRRDVSYSTAVSAVVMWPEAGEMAPKAEPREIHAATVAPRSARRGPTRKAR